MKKSKWIVSAKFDLLFFTSPGIIALFAVILFSDWDSMHSKMNPIIWAVLVLGFDVAHVYSTLYRSYWNREEFAKNKTVFLITPFLCYFAGVLFYSFGKLIFWKAAAYLAVFHFMRQQFGFMAIYRKKNNPDSGDLPFYLDKYAVYFFTLIPVAYWHFTEQKRVFSWFIENDFFFFKNQSVADILLVLLALYFFVWIFAHIYTYFKKKFFDLGKFLFLLSTAITWYFGIVYFNSDLIFTATNVLSHGIPYIALIWVYIRKSGDTDYILLGNLQKKTYVLFSMFALSLFLLTYFEEFLWDIFIWKDHPSIFGNWDFIPSVSVEIQTFLVPALFLPQVTHYVLDGFIWKFDERSPKLAVSLGLDYTKNKTESI